MKKFAALLLALISAAALALSASAYRENTTVYAPRFTKAPVIDGVITAEEWGEPTACAKVFIGRRWYEETDEGNIVCSEQCYFDISSDGVLYTNDISFDLWLRWDEEYVYIGVVSKDKYGLAYGDAFDENEPYNWLWNGDSLQFGIDPAGANSTGNPAQPFEKWSNKTYVVGRYQGGEQTAIRSDDRSSGAFDRTVEGAKAAIGWNDGVWKSFCGEANDEPGYACFEVAVPYSAFGGSVADGKKNGFGITVARVSATAVGSLDDKGENVGTGKYECWLSWGDGVMGSQKDQLPEDRCGSNSVILADTPAVGAGAADIPVAVVTEAPDTTPEETTAADTTADTVEEATAADTSADSTAADDTTAADTVSAGTTADKASEETTAAPAASDSDKSAGKRTPWTLFIIFGIVIIFIVVAIVYSYIHRKAKTAASSVTGESDRKNDDK